LLQIKVAGKDKERGVGVYLTRPLDESQNVAKFQSVSVDENSLISRELGKLPKLALCPFGFGVQIAGTLQMPDKTYLVRFKESNVPFQLVRANRFEIHVTVSHSSELTANCLPCSYLNRRGMA